MKLKTAALLLALTGLAASVYRQWGAGKVTVNGADLQPLGARDDGRPPRGSSEDRVATAASGFGTGAESPNGAERLREREREGVGVGEGASIGAAAPLSESSEDLFASTSQRGSQAAAPGLPDFFRGA